MDSDQQRDRRGRDRAAHAYSRLLEAAGARTYATEAVAAGSEESSHDLAADAVAAVASFAAAFEDALPAS